MMTLKRVIPRRQAQDFLQKMDEFEFVFMLHRCLRIFTKLPMLCKVHRFYWPHVQTCTVHFCNLFPAYEKILMRLRNKQKLVLPDVEYKTLRRRRRVRKPQQNDCRANDALDDIPPRDKFRIHSFIPVLDALYSNSARRATAYKRVADHFSFS